MLQSLQQRRERLITDRRQRGGGFFPHRLYLVLQQWKQRLYGTVILDFSQCLRRMHADDPIPIQQRTDQRSQDPLIRDRRQHGGSRFLHSWLWIGKADSKDWNKRLADGCQCANRRLAYRSVAVP